MGNLFPGIRLFQKLVEHRRHFLNAKEGPAVAYTVELICSPFNVPCCIHQLNSQHKADDHIQEVSVRINLIIELD